MTDLEQKTNIWKLRKSYITSIISIALVMFILGIAGLLVLNTNKVTKYVKENIGFSVILKKDAKESDIRKLQKDLDASKFVIATKYVTPEEAAHELQKDLGEEFVYTLGYNPLSATIDVRLNTIYANVDSLKVIKNDLLRTEIIQDIFFREDLVNLINNNINKISIILLIFIIALTVISAALINNAIRLTIYAKRFLIYTKSLVGATEEFIRKPFIMSSVINGAIGSGVAIVFLVFVIISLQQQLKGIFDIQSIGILFILVIIAGILLSTVSTFFAVNKYMRADNEQLYNL